MACCGASITLSCTCSNSRPVEGGTIAVRGSCSAMRRVCTGSAKQAAMAAGVGGSESPALLYGGAQPSRWVWPAMAQRLQTTKRSWLLSLSVSVCVVLITPFKASASKSNGVRKKHHGSDESTTTLGPNCSGFVSAFVQWTDLLQINKSTCRNVWFLILFSFPFFVFFAVLVTTMMLSGML